MFFICLPPLVASIVEGKHEQIYEQACYFADLDIRRSINIDSLLYETGSGLGNMYKTQTKTELSGPWHGYPL